jgi:hypothetical protein
MKIKCPVCGADLWTNPFQPRSQLTCPSCQSHLHLSAQTETLLKGYLAADVCADAVVCGIISQWWGTEKASLLFFALIASGWMFEMPQRDLRIRGLLQYEKSEKQS